MTIKKMIELAKNGDYLGYEYLDSHYEPILKEYVKNNYGQKNSEEFIEIMTSLIKNYINENTGYDLIDYLRKQADILYKEKRKLIGSEINLEDESQKEFILNHYTNALYEKLLGFNTVLTEKQIKKYSYKLIKDFYLDLLNDNQDIRVHMSKKINYEMKMYRKDSDNILKKYIVNIGLTDNILNYFEKKYIYVLDDFKTKRSYNSLKENYRKIVREALESLNSPGLKIELIIRKTLTKKACFYKTEQDQMLKNNRENNAINFDTFYNCYAYIKELIFNKFKDRLTIDEKTLKEEIEKKYCDFIKAYLNGKTKKDMTRYLNTRLTNHFNNKEASEKQLIQDKKREEIINDNCDLIDLIINKSDFFVTDENLREVLKKHYLECYDKYIKKERKTTFRQYTYTRLKIESEKYGKLYDINYVDDVASSIKSKISMIPKDIIDELFESWVSFYEKSSIHKKISFEEFMIKTLSNYNEEDYRRIIDVKEHINCKVLKR